MAPHFEHTYDDYGNLDLADLPQTLVDEYYPWRYKRNAMDWTHVETTPDAALVHVKCHVPIWNSSYCDHEDVTVDGNVLVMDNHSYGISQTRSGSTREYWTQLPAHLEQYKDMQVKPSFVHFDVLRDCKLHAKQFQIGGAWN
jgi:hypothetical protein